MQKDFPYETIKKMVADCGLPDVGLASIRELRRLVAEIEAKTGLRFVRMEMGIPGLPAPAFAVEAEAAALMKGVASFYPDIEGIPELRKEAARFIKNFLDLKAYSHNCFASVGAMQACFATLMVAGRMEKERDTVLLLEPCFPVHKQMIKMIGLNVEGFDVFHFRGPALKAQLEGFLKHGHISCILYSNPNNPSWICFTEEELKIIADLAQKYDVLILEDLAYLGMDFREDLGKPGTPPFQATVGHYTDRYVIFISSSKIFSYAGQRVGLIFVPDYVLNLNRPDLLRYYPSANFGHALVYGSLYATTSGVSHSAQWGLQALLKAANEGKYDFVAAVREYGRRARVMKELFLKYGFHLIYAQDGNKPLADGFYFTIGYPGLSGRQLVKELLYHGISAIALETTGSRQEGVRACVSFVSPDQFETLEDRLSLFQKHNPISAK